MFVKVPSFSETMAAGIRKTSVLISSVLSSPLFISGESFQKLADSISKRSRTTSQSRFRQSASHEPGVHASYGWVLPHDEHALDGAGFRRHEHRKGRIIGADLRQQIVTKVVFLRGAIPVKGLEQRHHVLREVVPPPSARRFSLQITL